MTTNASAPAALDQLAPNDVWAHFGTLCRIPRQSKQEDALRDHLRQWAEQTGLATVVDQAGNLIIRKPATPGRESTPGLVLQGHLDMVCQKNSDSAHDFSRDPIRPVLADGWVKAEGTTLGADNGMGVAMILALLADKATSHGPLEALFTVDEEAGMGGAQGLQPGLLQGRLMLNLDTEEWGEFYLGCAGGMDVNVQRPGMAQPVPAGHEAWRISLTGLRGGHSGVNIHEERGNAIKLLVRVLIDLSTAMPLRLAQLQGGTARNALPREAFALITLPAAQAARLNEALARWQALLAQELEGVEPGIKLQAEPAPVEQTSHVMDQTEQTTWLRSLHAAPHGVRRMSQRVPGVVETSNNLGMIELTPQSGSCNFMVRSLRDSGSQALADEIVSLWALSGTTAEQSGAYPGWTPNPDSTLLKLCQQVYQREFNSASSVQVIHAGLECGIIAAKYPGMDIVSFGPTIRGAHAPGEQVEVASVARTWQLLLAIVSAIGA
ncbi:MAG: aminoacyl-histidine dipeptidase [Aquabacterium sp.]|uniref:aminoacyl-histidine dipeptidase n=1 Tax=Aquabacterium sp. TaxID=1872578 RepID=UPI00122AFC84|nr:aminoacyl-histidine dipeptidase [Aquabacterium sp.]TAK96110.1 MAG: aminoacyl-histidine dipeptidase [Aquabacterium sp.]